MSRLTGLLPLLAATLAISCTAAGPALERSAGSGGRSSAAPAGVRPAPAAGAPRIAWSETARQAGSEPVLIDLAALPAGVEPRPEPPAGVVSRIDSPVPEAELERLRAEALALPPSAAAGRAASAAPGVQAPSPGVSFDSLDFTDTFGFTPPDFELAVGPGHLVVASNVAFAVYDKAGTLLTGPTAFSTFFAGVPACATGILFDPNVVYDESADRFVLGVDRAFTDYCVAATTGSDPTSTWYGSSFVANIGGFDMDFPHAGVGVEAIFVGSNQFAGDFFAEGRVFAIDKSELYAGLSPTVVTRSIGSHDTPQPTNLHGFLQGTWPAAGPHYIVAEIFNGRDVSIWSWDDPFGSDLFALVGTVDLVAATGVAAGLPVFAPQSGSAAQLQPNDWRPLDAEYRNGHVWTTQSIGCNPGAGPVDCVRWARIDPGVPAVVDAGVLASDGDYRLYPDLAVNHCDDMAVGYTRTSSSIFPAAWVTGRLHDDPPGTLQAEVELKAGEIVYTGFDSGPCQNNPVNPPCHRWGDYSGMTIDPDGETFWYVGEYSKDTGAVSTRWGGYVGAFGFAACTTPILDSTPPSLDFGSVAPGGSASLEVTLANLTLGSGDATVSSMTVADPTHFSIDPSGGADPCGTTTPTVPPGDSCTVEVVYAPAFEGELSTTLDIASDSIVEPAQSVALAGGTPCTFPLSLTLPDETENGTVTHQACESIQAGPYTVGPTGDVTLRAGIVIELRDDADFGGVVTFEIGQPIGTP